MRGAQKKRRMQATDRNYSGGSFNLKQKMPASPATNHMHGIGEAPPLELSSMVSTSAILSSSASVMQPSSSVVTESLAPDPSGAPTGDTPSVVQSKPSSSSPAPPALPPPEAKESTIRRISNGLAKFFGDIKVRPATAAVSGGKSTRELLGAAPSTNKVSTLATPVVPEAPAPPRAASPPAAKPKNTVAPTQPPPSLPHQQLDEPASPNPDVSSKRHLSAGASFLAPLGGTATPLTHDRRQSGGVMRRLSVQIATALSDVVGGATRRPSQANNDAVQGDVARTRSRSKSISESLGALVQPHHHRQPVDVFGQGTVTQTGMDASFVDENLHVLIDGAGNQDQAAEFARSLVECVSDVFIPYVRSEDFMWCKNPAQIAGDMKHHLAGAIEKARAPFTNPADVAAASMGVAVIHRDTSTPVTMRLHCIHIGNTKTIVVRKGEVAYESSSLVHGFNRPGRITSVPYAAYEPVYEMFVLESGDIVASMSDGVTNHMYAHEIVETIHAVSRLRNSCWDWVAQEIAQVAQARADQPLHGVSPFAKQAAAELYLNIDTDPELMSKYAPLLRKETNMKATALFRHTKTHEGVDFDLDQLVTWATVVPALELDDATVVISAVP
ncbi:Aste57867_22338 [Aphanomyces stellatus]|uniref:Protein phosphatase n=1 Tax=Aphanomyces stellatus TaxID=120398 RepID=A0A485LPR9_9STRA|nr:hypothetical protein As57867_022268 [Aphanomyces stellatus]VFT99001.1 Aste57867_22338 [Aphanomyces stellatus]